MKNVHVLPKDKPSRFQHIYITSDESLKKEDWKLSKEGIIHNNWGWNFGDKKIILTTDPDLIGVQSIDDEFLEWFVKNPSCEEVEVQDMSMQYHDEGYYEYKIIIPQEEPKQEWNPTQGEEVWIKVFSNWSKGIYIGYDVTKETHIVREDDEGGGHLMSSSQVLPYCEMPNKPKQEEPKQELPQLGTKEFNDLASAYFEGKLNHLASAYFGGEPKQETLEESAEKLYLSHENNELLYGHSEDLQLAYKAGILDGAKWQAERMYSEEDMAEAFIACWKANVPDGIECKVSFNEWFEQFKKK